MPRDLDVSSEESVNSTYKALVPVVIELISSDDEAEIDIIKISSDADNELKTDGAVLLASPTPMPPSTTKVDVIVPPTAGNGLLSANRKEDSSSLKHKGKKPKIVTDLQGVDVMNDADDDGTNEDVHAAVVKTESVQMKCYEESKCDLNCSG
ncbi:uncharacterized protein [Primulina eburnea]|uniref:uncharacterized protein n=1 Tax=Primulina eburnea TaxID=1245227 RepID=UPI003C6CB916